MARRPERIPMNTYLTAAEGQAEFDRRAATYTGMAHFAGTGPAGQFCRGCVNWKPDGWHGDKGAVKGSLKPGTCAAAARMSSKKVPQNTVPHDARACKYFEARDQEVRLHRPEIGQN